MSFLDVLPGVNGLGDLLGGVGGLANPFGVPSLGEWNLAPATFTINNKTIQFYVFKDDPNVGLTGMDQIVDNGGRRLARYEYPYRDGQSIEDLGRKGETYVFNIKFFGLNYQTLFNQFINIVVNERGIGQLIHPVRSHDTAISCRFESWEFVHKHDEWNAVNIKATFVEDSSDKLFAENNRQASTDSALRSGLQLLTNIQSNIQQGIFNVAALLKFPAAVKAAMLARLAIIGTDFSRLLGQLAATFAADVALKSVAAFSNTTGTGVSGLNSGTVATTTTAGQSTTAQLPPVYQVGFNQTTQASINAQVNDYANANQITTQQAIFAANSVRDKIRDAITEIQFYMGNDGYDIEVLYRSLSVQVQTVVEACISTTQSSVKIYTVPFPMSLRKLAFLNGLTPDQQNSIEAFNPYLPSLNYLPKGTEVTVPA